MDTTSRREFMDAYANVPLITYNKSSTHNDNEDTHWIIDHFQQNILVKLPFVNPYKTAICQNMQLEIISTF